MPIGWARWAACPPTSSASGDVYVSSRYYGYYTTAPAVSDILRVNWPGQVVQVIPVG